MERGSPYDGEKLVKNRLHRAPQKSPFIYLVKGAPGTMPQLLSFCSPSSCLPFFLLRGNTDLFVLGIPRHKMSLSGQIEGNAGEKSAAWKGPTALYSGNKLPSNDLNELFRRLQQQSKDGGFRLLDAHLRESTLVLQEEISRLPHYIRSQVPHFDSIATLSENGYLRHLALGPAIETALLIVLQLGLFIR